MNKLIDVQITIEGPLFIFWWNTFSLRVMSFHKDIIIIIIVCVCVCVLMFIIIIIILLLFVVII